MWGSNRPKQGLSSHLLFYFTVLSFACAKESTKEKHTGNDIQPLPAP